MDHLFYRHRRLLVLSLILIVVAGISSYQALPRMEDPLLVPRFAVVNTRYPGATAERVETLVTDRLEQELREISEIKELRSTSRGGISTITLELRDAVTDTSEVWSRVRDRLDHARSLLPVEAAKPDFDERDVKAFALIVALRWDWQSPPTTSLLARLAEELKDRLLSVPGTEDVKLFGQPEEEFLVTVTPEELASRGLTIPQVAAQLAASDAKVSSGQIRGVGTNTILELDTELTSVVRIAETPVRFGHQGESTRLGDIASVTKSYRDPPRSESLVSGKSAVALGVLVRDDKRIDAWNDDVQQVLRSFRMTLPAGINAQEIFVQQKYVGNRLEALQQNLLLGAALVVIVIGCLMGWRNAIVVGVSLPLASLMVLSGLQWLGIPLHQMSVTGLILALGLLIDNAIVVVDEVSAKMRAGIPPATAVASTTRHLAIPLLGSTVTTALAFAPIALMPGPAGEFVSSIAISVILAIVSSLGLALTIVPALAAMVSPKQTAADRRTETNVPIRHGAARRFWRSWLVEPYRRCLESLFRFPVLVGAIAVIPPLLGFFQARTLPTQFFPPADRDQFQVELELPSDTPLQQTRRLAQQIRDVLREDSQVADVHWFLGESAPVFYYNLVGRRSDTPHYAQAIVQLRDVPSSEVVIHQLQSTLDSRFPEARVLVRQLEQGPPFDAPVELRLLGPDLETLEQIAENVRSVLAQTEGVIHTRTESATTQAKLAIRVDEEAARQAGLDHRAIANQLDAFMEGTLGGLVVDTTEDLPIRIRVANSDRGDFSRVGSLELVPSKPWTGETPNGLVGVPLSAIASFQAAPERAAIERLNGVRMVEIQAFIPAGDLPTVVLERFFENWRQAGHALPAGYSLQLGGEAAKRDEAIGNLMGSLGPLLVIMLATLVLSFQSFRMAALIGAVGVLSIGLGLGSIGIFGYPFGFMAIVGTMGLVGVAINDSIVVLAALRENDQAARGDFVATADVVMRSTRHVVATSVTTIAGFLPLVMSGGGFWPPLAIAIAGGVSGATILALCFVPAMHLLVARRAARVDISPNPMPNSNVHPRDDSRLPHLGLPCGSAS